jgi:O-antigen ligase
VALVGVLTNLVFGRRQRLKMPLVIGLIALAIYGVLLSPYGHSLQKGLDRTFGGNRTSSQRTSGRSDQWLVAWHAFDHSFQTVLVGHGPGNGPEVYARYSSDVAGVKYAVGKKVALHSLFMQIMVETGLLGLFTVVGWLLVCLVKIFRRQMRTQEILPLVCFLGYGFIVITVSGNDINSGIFLGIALLGTAAVGKSLRDITTSERRNSWKPARTN